MIGLMIRLRHADSAPTHQIKDLHHTAAGGVRSTDDSRWPRRTSGAKTGHTVDVRKPFRRVVAATGLDPDQILLTMLALRGRFDKARSAAGVHFRFRDIRAKTASDTGDFGALTALAGSQEPGHDRALREGAHRAARQTIAIDKSKETSEAARRESTLLALRRPFPPAVACEGWLAAPVSSARLERAATLLRAREKCPC